MVALFATFVVRVPWEPEGKAPKASLAIERAERSHGKELGSRLLF
jgi:hypothetical protein